MANGIQARHQQHRQSIRTQSQVDQILPPKALKDLLLLGLAYDLSPVPLLDNTALLLRNLRGRGPDPIRKLSNLTTGKQNMWIMRDPTMLFRESRSGQPLQSLPILQHSHHCLSLESRSNQFRTMVMTLDHPIQLTMVLGQ